VLVQEVEMCPHSREALRFELILFLHLLWKLFSSPELELVVLIVDIHPLIRELLLDLVLLLVDIPVLQLHHLHHLNYVS